MAANALFFSDGVGGDNLGVGGVDGVGLGLGRGDVVGVHNINKKIKLAHFCNLAQSSVKMGNFVRQGLALLAVRLLLQEDAFHFLCFSGLVRWQGGEILSLGILQNPLSPIGDCWHPSPVFLQSSH